MTAARQLRSALNWANFSTPAGLLLAVAAGCRLRSGDLGLIYATGYRPRLPVAGAFTVGNVVLFRAPAGPVGPALAAHEARHSTQYACCLGLPFLPLYLLAAAWSLLRSGDYASRNVFERLAGLEAGGYTERPARPWLARLRRGRQRRCGTPPLQDLTEVPNN